MSLQLLFQYFCFILKMFLLRYKEYIHSQNSLLYLDLLGLTDPALLVSSTSGPSTKLCMYQLVTHRNCNAGLVCRGRNENNNRIVIILIESALHFQCGIRMTGKIKE